MASKPILLDYQSSTPCLDQVIESMNPYWNEIFANPSNRNNLAGISASAALEVSRERIIRMLHIKDKKVIFTSGATESNNLALLGFARNFHQKSGKYGNIITLKTEHNAVLEPLRQLKKEGFNITEIKPEEDGLITKEKFINALKPDTFLVTIMVANNEIGVIQPVEMISNICNSRGIVFHTDAAQSLGYMPFEAFNLSADMITLSSHKIYGPKVAGALIVDKSISLSPLLHGGGQEFGLRAGTIPLPLIVGFVKAIELAILRQVSNKIQLQTHRNYLLKGLLENNSDIYVNGSMSKRLPHNLNITFPNVPGSLLHKKLKAKIICSSGSACSNGKPSHVLLALGRSFKEAESSIRLSIGLMTKSEEIEESVQIISDIVKSLR